ncbi:MAG: protein-L-isoaspartate(D-aspartate) O-methyltransferase [Thermoplasmatota archaeon]
MESVERMDEREDLLSQVEANGSLTDPLVEEAMLAVPRHVFVPEAMEDMAYDDRPLPIGFDQTISAPHMVAQMTCALQLEPGHKVLEIGSGVGYQAAVLAAVTGVTVHTIEYLPELAECARQNLAGIGADVQVHVGDGYDGWPDESPFEAILITCAVPQVPPTLAGQLKKGGHLVAPLGVTRCELMVARKLDGRLEKEYIAPCLFVNAQGRLGRPGPDDAAVTAMP